MPASTASWIDRSAPPIKLVEILLGQYYGYGFCYFLIFKCTIRPEYQTGIEDGYVSEGRPDANEPKIREYQKQIESFLARFVPGIFLSEKPGNKLRCPSVRILVADEIDFEKFENWTNAHFGFLRYLGIFGPASRVDCYLIAYQPEQLLKDQGIFAGLTFVCSKIHYKAVSSDLEAEILANVSFFFEMRLLAWFIAIYWAAFNLERQLPQWEDKISTLEEQLRGLLTLKKYRVRPIRPVYAKLMVLHNEFESFLLEEERKVSIMQRSLSRIKPPKSDQALPVFSIQLDILEDLAQGVRFLDEERDRLGFIRRKIASIFEQCKQFTDFALQSSMRTLTLAAVAKPPSVGYNLCKGTMESSLVISLMVVFAID